MKGRGSEQKPQSYTTTLRYLLPGSKRYMAPDVPNFGDYALNTERGWRLWWYG
jgi:hypothetical protein